jgi:hypothetical protein
MLTVKTYLAPSAIHGIGLFAAETIPANSKVWQYSEYVDKIYSEELFLQLCQNVNLFTLQHMLTSSYKRGGRYFYLTDNTRFINHSVQANIAFEDDYSEIALRQINAHEEILENYLLSYDPSDFFFHEFVNPDPLTFLSTILQQDKNHAAYQDLS